MNDEYASWSTSGLLAILIKSIAITIAINLLGPWWKSIAILGLIAIFLQRSVAILLAIIISTLSTQDNAAPAIRPRADLRRV